MIASMCIHNNGTQFIYGKTTNENSVDTRFTLGSASWKGTKLEPNIIWAEAKKKWFIFCYFDEKKKITQK